MRSRMIALLLGIALIGWSGLALAADDNPPANTGTVTSTGHPSDTAQPMHHHHAGHMNHMGHHRAALHGGKVYTTTGHEFETVFDPDGIRVYVYGSDRTPEQATGVAGTATLKFKDGTIQDVTLTPEQPKPGEKTVYFCPKDPKEIRMKPGNCKDDPNTALVAQDRLFGAVDLSKAEHASVTASFHITSLAGNETEATFSETGMAMHHMASHMRPAHAAKAETKS